MTDRLKLPKAQIPQSESISLPFNGKAVTDKSFSFSFACFDRTHDFFNLGDNTPDGTVSGKWFLDMLDCLKEVCNKTISELRYSMYDLHPINWKFANIAPPRDAEQLDYWQFRINKSRGRIIGFKIDNTFYIVWFDPHHNLTNSDGYGTAEKYRAPVSEYEDSLLRIAALEQKLSECENNLKAAEELLK